MEIFAGLCVGLLLLSAGVVAIKTFALWRRTRGLPELLLALMLLCSTVLGYPLAIASNQIPLTEMWPLHVGFAVFINLGFACLLLFTSKVFRPGVLWATCLAWLSMSIQLVCTGIALVGMLGENPHRPGAVLTLISTVPVATAYFWTMFEALGYYRRMKLQLRLGLAKPLVTNRMLLWGLMGLAAGFAVVVNTGALLSGVDFYRSPTIVTVSSFCGLAHASCLFLAFHPPTWYRSWVELGEAVETS